MSNKISDTILTAGSGTGVFLGVSLTDIYSFLGIILTVINICILVYTIGRNVYYRIKDGKFTNEEKAETAKEILQLKETIDELNKQIENENKEVK